MAIPLSYNLRSVLQRPISTLLTAFGVAMTVMIFIGALALAQGFQTALVNTGSNENVIVLRKGASSEISSGIGLDATSILRANPAVAVSAEGRPLFSPEVVVLVVLQRKGMPGSANVTVRGIDAEGLALRQGARVKEGRMFTPGSDEIVVGVRTAERFAGAGLGERIRLGTRDFEIVGLIEAGGSAFESEIWGDSRVLMPVFRGEVYQSITFRLRDGADFEAFKTEVAEDKRLGLEATQELEFYSRQSELLATVMRVAGTMITLIMAIGAVFGAMNTMAATVSARGREIATLMVIGFRPGAVMFSFLFESVLLCLLGGVLGCLLALPLNGIQTSTTNWASFSELAFAFQVRPQALGAGLLYAALMGLVGGFIPAFRAARQPLATSLREG